MKGMVFTEMLDMVESTWSLDMVDAIIARANLPHGGAYTAVGTYPHEEIVALVVALSAETGIPVADLVRAFGKHLFERFAQLYTRFFEGITGSFQFLTGIEDVIHAEVRKLYPDAELPTFEVEKSGDTLSLTYFSEHPFADLAEGLIAGCIAHFGEKIDLKREAVSGLPGAQARFILTNRSPGRPKNDLAPSGGGSGDFPEPGVQLTRLG